jgi:hypothetical protein
LKVQVFVIGSIPTLLPTSYQHVHQVLAICL